MGYFYIDESIRESAGFIIAAFVYSEKDISHRVMHCIEQVGLIPREDEFKSGIRMIDNPKQKELRSMLGSVLFDCKLGLMVIPSPHRKYLGDEALKGLRQIIDKCGLTGVHTAFFDEEIKPNNLCDFDNVQCELKLEQDSKIIGGIQLADLAAHTFGTMFLEELGVINKTTPAGKNSGYPEDLEIELGFELWAGIRYSLFISSRAHGEIEEDPLLGATFDVEGYGLYISELCDDKLKMSARKRFGTNYLGCIH